MPGVVGSALGLLGDTSQELLQEHLWIIRLRETNNTQKHEVGKPNFLQTILSNNSGVGVLSNNSESTTPLLDKELMTDIVEDVTNAKLKWAGQIAEWKTMGGPPETQSSK